MKSTYPVSVSGVGARADVQQVVAVSGKGAAGLVVHGALGSAAGAFLTLLLWRCDDAQVGSPGGWDACC